MVSKLEVYNFGLGYVGERKLASLSEAVECRRVFDDFWDQAVDACLENGLWNFAKRSVSITPSESVTPSFGYSSAFEKPSDWVSTMRISDHEFFDPPLIHVIDENDLWYADVALLYVEYVSNGTDFGKNLALWPPSFTDYVAHSLARRSAKRLTSSDSLEEKLEKKELQALRRARSRDAMNQPPGFPPTGTWVRSRGTGMMSRRSRWDGTVF
jgi:hypothetical protein